MCGETLYCYSSKYHLEPDWKYQLESPAQSAETAEYTHCISTELDLPNEYPGYDIKQSDNEAPNLEL